MEPRGNNSKLETTFTPAILTRGCEIAVVGLRTYYSYLNVDKTNNLVNITGTNVNKKLNSKKGV